MPSSSDKQTSFLDDGASGPDGAMIPMPTSDESAALSDAEAFAIALARDSAAQAAADAEDAEGGNYTEQFKPAPEVPGEILVSINEIRDWEYHLRAHSPKHAEHASALALTADDPRSFRPVELVEKDGRYHLKNGRYILEAIKAAHPDDHTLLIRAVVFPGTEQEAVVAMCDDVLGSAVATKMEMAHGLLSLRRACHISQIALAERYPGLNQDKVSRMLIAARLQRDFPIVFDILEAPHKAPISYGVTVSAALRGLGKAEVRQTLDIAERAVADGMRFKSADALELLGIVPMASTSAAQPRPITPVESDDILGHDEQPVGARERLADNIERLRLPNVADMSVMEREVAAEAFIAEIRRHFGLA